MCSRGAQVDTVLLSSHHRTLSSKHEERMARQTSHPITLHTLFLLLTIFLLSTPTLCTPSPKKKDCYKTVKPNQSIQAALTAAKKGDTITVEAGTYTEYLTISKSDITLIGKPGAKLVSPSTPPSKPNPCTGLAEVNGTKVDAGICIHGKNVVLDVYKPELQHRKFISVEQRVKNVVVSGLTIQGYQGINVAVVAGSNVRVKHNTLLDGGQYGFLSVGSKDTLAAHNAVKSSAGLLGIAMCMDDYTSAEFSNNDIAGYFIALCTQTARGVVKKNTVKQCCIGPFVDPGIVGARVIENTVRDRNPACPPGEKSVGAGIVLLGARDTIVKRNVVEGIRSGGFGVGVFISDDAATGEKATGNVVQGNRLKDNDLDVLSVAAGANTVQGNTCGSGLPPGDMCQ